MAVEVFHLLEGLSPLQAGENGLEAAAQLLVIDLVEDRAHLGVAGNPQDMEDAPEVVGFFLAASVKGQEAWILQ